MEKHRCDRCNDFSPIEKIFTEQPISVPISQLVGGTDRI
jgi:hypothetical protein